MLKRDVREANESNKIIKTKINVNVELNKCRKAKNE